jgi:hypothetical protein
MSLKKPTVAETGEKGLPRTEGRTQRVLCGDYRRFLEAPKTISSCDQKIAIIRHAASCTACLDFAFELLLQLPLDRQEDDQLRNAAEPQLTAQETLGE